LPSLETTNHFLYGDRKIDGNVKLVSLEELQQMTKQFDVIVGNPPFQSGNERDPLWCKFIRLSFDAAKEGGYVSLIHPCGWRRVGHKLYELFQKNNVIHLKINNGQAGQKVFGVGSRYDVHLTQKLPYTGETTIVDEDGVKGKFSLSSMEGIPHNNIRFFVENSLSADEGGVCEMIYDFSYETRQKHMSDGKSFEFKHPCVHATSKTGVKLRWSKTNERGHFGVKKVIMGMASPERGFFDKNGEYAMTQHVFAIVVKNDKDGEDLVKCLQNPQFQKIMKGFVWAGFQTDWKVFAKLRYGFWRDFV
jgi:hypothetical protein